jgi:hypothetical protein
MASERQIAANRNNAKKSTGPRSEAGRLRSRGNALRHGLATAIGSGPAVGKEIERLVTILTTGRPDAMAAARDVAEAEIDLQRIRKIRALLLDECTSETNPTRRKELSIGLARLERYGRRAYSRHRRALRALWAD